MRRKYRAKFWAMGLVGIAVFALIFVGGFGWAVHHLWNLLMPEIFGLPSISFWQAVGLLALSWLLFGGWRGLPRGRRYWGGGGRRGWEGLTPEEREHFVRRMRSCGSREAPPAEDPGSSGS
jgi:hypothetical protein